MINYLFLNGTIYLHLILYSIIILAFLCLYFFIRHTTCFLYIFPPSFFSYNTCPRCSSRHIIFLFFQKASLFRLTSSSSILFFLNMPCIYIYFTFFKILLLPSIIYDLYNIPYLFLPSVSFACFRFLYASFIICLILLLFIP